LRTEDQLLFPDPRGGVLSNKVPNRWYRELAQEAGVRRITSHGARHTAGSNYAVMGAGQSMGFREVPDLVRASSRPRAGTLRMFKPRAGKQTDWPKRRGARIQG
jgi:integrase